VTRVKSKDFSGEGQATIIFNDRIRTGSRTATLIYTPTEERVGIGAWLFGTVATNHYTQYNKGSAPRPDGASVRPAMCPSDRSIAA
jgi:hypothetical protein